MFLFYSYLISTKEKKKKETLLQNSYFRNIYRLLFAEKILPSRFYLSKNTFLRCFHTRIFLNQLCCSTRRIWVFSLSKLNISRIFFFFCSLGLSFYIRLFCTKKRGFCCIFLYILSIVFVKCQYRHIIKTLLPFFFFL